MTCRYCLAQFKGIHQRCPSCGAFLGGGALGV